MCLLPGKDNIIHAVELRTINKSGKPNVIKRSVCHLYPVEVRDFWNSYTEKKETLISEPTITFVGIEDASEIIK